MTDKRPLMTNTQQLRILFYVYLYYYMNEQRNALSLFVEALGRMARTGTL